MTPVQETKSIRAAIKDLVEQLNSSERKSRSRSLAITKLEESSMWLGKDLQELNEPTPYPNSFNPDSPVIDPTAPEACKLGPQGANGDDFFLNGALKRALEKGDVQ